MGKNKKKYYDERSKKIGRKKKRKKGINGFRYKEANYPYEIDMDTCIRKAPNIFSFQENLEETVEYFSTTVKELEHGGFRKQFIIDSRNVTFVTIDVIMYLIAIMKNIRFNIIQQYTFKGYYPYDDSAKKIYEESGFSKFVRSKSKRLPANTEKLQIISGYRNLGEEAKKICDFVIDKFSKDRKYTQKLYSVLIEMMSNVYFHAYNDNQLMKPMWYTYAEYDSKNIKIVFLDTGIGIANTVHKHNMYEKLVRKFGSRIINDSYLILSALNGEFRTNTEEENRGRGLPSIKDFAFSEYCSEFSVLSGKGYCKMENKGTKELTCYDVNEEILGTIYMFTIKNCEV
jgi:hypothetical protein